MLRPRIIPCLLVKDQGLVKTVQFSAPKYVGDPMNAVKIFNEKEVDELMVLDIDATAQGREPDYKMIKNLAVECRMPLCYGGGVRTADQVREIIGLGAEKVAISSAALENPALIEEAARAVGSQSIVVVLDVRKRRFGGSYHVYTHNGSRDTKRSPTEAAAAAEKLGAGEIVLNSIDHDGVMKGYDLAVASQVRDAITVPMTVLGGAGSLQDIGSLIEKFGIVGAAAGSLFVFKGVYRAVLISYPRHEEKEAIMSRYSSGA
jgi:imidazole glycerol-phosphate synthase subunit HisF